MLPPLAFDWRGHASAAEIIQLIGPGARPHPALAAPTTLAPSRHSTTVSLIHLVHRLSQREPRPSPLDIHMAPSPFHSFLSYSHCILRLCSLLTSHQNPLLWPPDNTSHPASYTGAGCELSNKDLTPTHLYPAPQLTIPVSISGLVVVNSSGQHLKHLRPCDC
jgi:hypothetical protein